MKSYSLGCITPEEHTLLIHATSMVEAIPDHMGENDLIRCHEIARAVGRILDLPVVDGHYGAVQHSWLMTKTPHAPKILDVYSVGRLPQVQLLVIAPATLHTQLFRPGSDRTDIRTHIVDRMVHFLRVRLNWIDLLVSSLESS